MHLRNIKKNLKGIITREGGKKGQDLSFVVEVVQGVYFKPGTFSAHTVNLKYIFELIFKVLSRQATYVLSNISVDLEQCSGLY